jgi:hypothetical protein
VRREDRPRGQGRGDSSGDGSGIGRDYPTGQGPGFIPSEVGVSLMSGSTSTPTPLVKTESDPGDAGTVHKKDAKVPDGHVYGTHPK